MAILSNMTTLKEFEECIRSASVSGKGRFLILGKGEFSYDQVADKFASLIPETPLPIDKVLARNIFTHLKNRVGSSDCMESIRKKLLYTNDYSLKEVSLENNTFFTEVLPKLFKIDPSTTAKLIFNNRDAKAVANKLSLFTIADRIYKWQEKNKIDFDKRFTIEEHETNYPIIFEKRLADWIKTGGAADKIGYRETAAKRIRTAYNGGQPGENTVLDLRSLNLTTIPGVIDAIPKLQRLQIKNNNMAVLENPNSIQYFSREVMLDLIEANHVHFQHIKRDLIDEEFIFEALSRNGAVLQHLRGTLQVDRGFLLQAVDKVPGILAHVPEGVKSDRSFMLSLVNVFAFGKEKWQEYYGVTVDDPPSLKDKIIDILCSKDPVGPIEAASALFYCPKIMVEVYVLVYYPKTINGKPLDLITFGTDAQAPIDLDESKYQRTLWMMSSWFLIRKDFIANNRAQFYEAQKTLMGTKGYMGIDPLSATLGCLIYIARAGDKPLPGVHRLSDCC